VKLHRAFRLPPTFDKRKTAVAEQGIVGGKRDKHRRRM
jgi:hypothetical protein